MTLKTYKSGDTEIWFKVIKGKAHPFFRQASAQDRQFNLGIAFRTREAPIGYFPFYGAKDFNLSGETSFKEEVLSRLPIDFSAAASPHTLLICEASEDVEFLGVGDGDTVDIQQAVKQDRLSHAMRAASGVFIDGVMAGLGGPAIKSVVDQLIRSKIRQFVLSKAISGAAKHHLKQQGNFDVDKFLGGAP